MVWSLKHCCSTNNIILAGDFNCCLNVEDRSTQTHIGDKSRNALSTLVDKLGLLDMWTSESVTCKGNHFTWSDHKTKSRLDYIFVSKMSTINVKEMHTLTVITDALKARITDHKALLLKCHIQVPLRGPGYWKFNSKLIDNEEYCRGIKEIIHTVESDTSYESISTKWGCLKMKIKEFSIKMGVEIAKQKRCEITILEKELLQIDSFPNGTEQQKFRKASIQQRLDELYSTLSEGAKIRSKVCEVNEIETNSELFKNIEQSRQSNNVIASLIDNSGKEINDQGEILDAMGKYYSNLYTSNNIDEALIDQYISSIDLERTLSDKQKSLLEKMPNMKEYEAIMAKMKDDKSPGLDGLTILFYRAFWEEIKGIYQELIEEVWEVEILPITTRSSVLSTLFKTNDRQKLANYRPLSMTNLDYRILAGVFANRMQSVLDTIINQDQSAYIKGRYIGTSVRNILDIFDFCENGNLPGALLALDFEKAFDSLEHPFMLKTLKKINFGPNFIKWIKILYTEPIFKIKNNGWVSGNYYMKRGVRQGCSVSALIFILAVELLSTAIRNDKSINGIQVDNTEYKVMQYADDLTVCVKDIKSVKNVINLINDFTKCAGPKLNMKKCRGIWLGTLKDLGFRLYNGILWTGKPVKCLGIYIGHDTDKCNYLNWNKKLEQVEQELMKWHKRKISLYGKVYVIKTYAISKIIYPLTVLSVPNYVATELKKLFYYYLWGKRDRVKRSNVCQAKKHGGLNMLDVDNFILSLKASWVVKIKYNPGKWQSIFKYYLRKIGFHTEYVWKMSFMSAENFPIIKHIPSFYQDVMLSFNKCKGIKSLNLLNESEIAQLPLWGCEYFKVKSTHLYLDQWVKHDIMYVKDLINSEGKFKSDAELYKCVKSHRTIIRDVYVIKNYVLKKIKCKNLQIAPFVKIKSLERITYNNSVYCLKECKSKTFYLMLCNKYMSRGNMESIYSREFSFPNLKSIWKSIYLQKMVCVKIPKLSEFNYKVLHNLVPCAKILKKWNRLDNDTCQYCGEIENTKHMLFECIRVQNIWSHLRSKINVNITWKNIVCGYPCYDNDTKIRVLNNVISIVAYSIFKCNSRCKFEKLDYKKADLMLKIRIELKIYEKLLSVVDYNVSANTTFKTLCEQF